MALGANFAAVWFADLIVTTKKVPLLNPANKKKSNSSGKKSPIEQEFDAPPEEIEAEEDNEN